MKINEIKQELIEQGKNPNDFDIELLENVYSITPKIFYETKLIAREENKPIKEDMDITAETLIFSLSDIEELADMLVYALVKIDELEERLNG